MADFVAPREPPGGIFESAKLEPISAISIDFESAWWAEVECSGGWGERARKLRDGIESRVRIVSTGSTRDMGGIVYALAKVSARLDIWVLNARC